MKRPPRSFVVEVRRQRRPPGEAATSWTEEALRSTSTFETVRPEPPAEPAPPPAVVTASAPARPTGRILPSLVEAPPAEAVAAEKPAPAKPRAPRRRRTPAPAPAKVAFVEPKPVVVAPPPVSRPAAAAPRPDDEPSRHQRILARYVFSGGLKPGDRWKRRLRGDKP